MAGPDGLNDEKEIDGWVKEEKSLGSGGFGTVSLWVHKVRLKMVILLLSFPRVVDLRGSKMLPDLEIRSRSIKTTGTIQHDSDHFIVTNFCR